MSETKVTIQGEEHSDVTAASQVRLDAVLHVYHKRELVQCWAPPCVILDRDLQRACRVYDTGQ